MGDYVLAFTLPGAGVPLPDTAAAPVEGAYAGETRGGGARIGFDLTIQAVGDSLTAAIARIDSLRVAGAVTVRRAGRSVTVRDAFDSREKPCAGLLTATA